MILSDNFNSAMKSIMSSKLRSLLTMLGVVIGIFSVVTLVSIGEAGKGFINFQVKQFGTGASYMEIHTGKKSEGHGAGELSAMLDSTLTREDLRAISRGNYVKQAIGHILGQGEFKYGHESFTTPLLDGTTYNLPDVMTFRVKEGKFFSKGDEASRNSVVVIGPTIAKKLFKNFSPIGEKVKINGSSFVVIGVLESKGSMLGIDIDSYCFIPITRAEMLFDTKKLMEIGVTAVDELSVPIAVNEITGILSDRHGEEDFRIDTQKESLDMLNNVMSTLTAMIAGIAAISLLVGGIGIMNIMLVSVTERTREIGIRKSIGATREDIVSQFLVESVLISVMGGAIGIVLGVMASLGIMKVLNLPLIVATWAAALAFVVAIIVGVLSGLYPAFKAALLDPIEALRFE